MEVEIFTACDNVQAYGDKLIIVGTFHQVNGRSKPLSCPNLGLACVIAFDASDVLRNNNIEFRFEDSFGEKYREPIKVDIEAAKDLPFRLINFAYNLGEVKFITNNIHYINLYFNQDLVRKFPIYIKQIE